MRAGVKEIGEGAFGGCSELISVTLPDSTIKIGLSAFENCYSEGSVVIKGNLDTMGTGLLAIP